MSETQPEQTQPAEVTVPAAQDTENENTSPDAAVAEPSTSPQDTAPEQPAPPQDFFAGTAPPEQPGTMATAPVASAANETPTLPPSAASAAAKAHAWLGHLVTVAQQAQGEIERFVPPELLMAAETEAKAFIQSIL